MTANFLDSQSNQQFEYPAINPSVIIGQSPIAIMITNLDGIIEYVNPKLLELTGYSEKEVIGQSPQVFMPDNSLAFNYQNLWQTVRAGKVWQGEFQNTTKSGELYWVNATISPIVDKTGHTTGYLAFEEDITATKIVENKLQHRNRELTILNQASQSLNSSIDLDQVLATVLEEVRNLLNVGFCSVWLVDQENGDLVCWQATEPFTKTLADWRLSPGEGIGGWVIQHNQSLVIGDALTDERHFKGVDEETGLIVRSILTVPLQVETKVIGVVQVVDAEQDRFDLSNLRLIESLAATAASAIEKARLFTDLHDAQEKLIHRERLATLGQVAATIAHELRNPLQAIRMGVEYLIRDIPPSDPRQRGAALTLANMNRIDRVVEDILFIARTPKLSLSPNLLRPLIEEEVSQWQLTLAEKQIELNCDCAPDLPPVKLDPEQIIRALSNLIGNSVAALPPGGRIQLSLQMKEEDQVIRLRDNGQGIYPDHLPHIFEPFFTTKTHGTGLGLSIVKQIIDVHHGRIEVSSELGEGTEFSITLPAL